jgi:hypothetical protein
MTMDTKRTIQRLQPVRILLVVLVLVSLFAWISIPNFVGGGPSKLSGIVNTLRQIDGAKQQWAFEHGITNSDAFTNEFTELDLAPYFSRSDGRDRIGRNGRPHPGVGERYTINPLNFSPEAQLTRDFKEGRGSTFSLPKGSIIRLSGSGYEIILPDGSKVLR